MKSVVIAYIAGMMDGEGSIFISKQSGLYCQLHIQISNTNLFLLEKIKEMLSFLSVKSYIVKSGNNVKKDKPWKQGWKLLINKKKNQYFFLELIEPYLIDKQKQARLVLKYSLKNIYDEIKELNKRGI